MSSCIGPVRVSYGTNRRMMSAAVARAASLTPSSPPAPIPPPPAPVSTTPPSETPRPPDPVTPPPASPASGYSPSASSSPSPLASPPPSSPCPHLSSNVHLCQAHSPRPRSPQTPLTPRGLRPTAVVPSGLPAPVRSTTAPHTSSRDCLSQSVRKLRNPKKSVHAAMALSLAPRAGRGGASPPPVPRAPPPPRARREAVPGRRGGSRWVEVGCGGRSSRAPTLPQPRRLDVPGLPLLEGHVLDRDTRHVTAVHRAPRPAHRLATLGASVQVRQPRPELATTVRAVATCLVTVSAHRGASSSAMEAPSMRAIADDAGQHGVGDATEAAEVAPAGERAI